ncbi:MFS transporter [Spongisporangium articulatum]|uniref:MFS transporter n=1 Tax=Spongisporangium articulatum TaxID=3362603 RepID=A0ABW8AII4_9ACTN
MSAETLPAPVERSTETSGTSTARHRAVLAVILTAQLMVVLDVSIVNIAMPSIQRALDFSPTGLSWVVNAYTLTFGGLLLLGARAGDLLGRRVTFITGLAIFTIASMVGGFAENPGSLLASRAAQGIGAALASPSALALLMTMFPNPKERTRAIGYYTAVSIGGAALGLIAGGLLTEWLSWRWVFFVNVPFAVAVIAGGRAFLVETPRAQGRFDLVGALTSTAGMTSLVYGFVSAASDGWTDVRTLSAFGAGVVLLAAFIAVELRAPAPITPLRLFLDRTRSTAYVARLLLVAGMMGVFFFLTQFLQDVLGYSPIRAGLAFLPLTAMVFLSSQVSARIWSQRFAPQYVIAAGLSISTVGLLWLSELHAGATYWHLLGPILLFGMGNGTAFVPLTTAGLSGVAPQDAGAASGLVNVTQQVGGSLGLAVLVTIFGSVSKGADVTGLSPAEAATHAFVVGADRSFLIASGWLLLTTLIVLTMLRPSRPTPVVAAQEPVERMELEPVADPA